MIDLPIYKQGDPRWSAKPLGTSTAHMGDSGCFVTSLAMATYNFGISDDPGETVDRLNAVNAFTPEGFLTYTGVMAAFPALYFNERVYTTNTPDANLVKMEINAAIAKVRRGLRLGQPVMLSVDLIGNDRNQDHCILAVGDATADDSPDFWIQDPAFGDRIRFKTRYGDPRTKLYGYISIIGPPISFPVDGDPLAGQALWKATQIAKNQNAQVYAREIVATLL